MKNFAKIYAQIKEIENNTLFVFEGVNDENEFIFVEDCDIFTQTVTVSKLDIYIDIPRGNQGVLIHYGELVSFTKLVEILKECEE